MRGVAVSFAMIGLAFGAYAAEPVVVAQRASPERAAALSAPEWVGRLEKAMAADDTVEAVIEYRPAASAALGPQRELGLKAIRGRASRWRSWTTASTPSMRCSQARCVERRVSQTPTAKATICARSALPPPRALALRRASAPRKVTSVPTARMSRVSPWVTTTARFSVPRASRRKLA